jgi:hypothetical protein
LMSAAVWGCGRPWQREARHIIYHWSDVETERGGGACAQADLTTKISRIINGVCVITWYACLSW